MLYLKIYYIIIKEDAMETPRAPQAGENRPPMKPPTKRTSSSPTQAPKQNRPPMKPPTKR